MGQGTGGLGGWGDSIPLALSMRDEGGTRGGGREPEGEGGPGQPSSCQGKGNARGARVTGQRRFPAPSTLRARGRGAGAAGGVNREAWQGGGKQEGGRKQGGNGGGENERLEH